MAQQPQNIALSIDNSTMQSDIISVVKPECERTLDSSNNVGNDDIGSEQAEENKRSDKSDGRDANSWKLKATTKSTILRDCSDLTIDHTGSSYSTNAKAAESTFNIPLTSYELINPGDIKQSVKPNNPISSIASGSSQSRTTSPIITNQPLTSLTEESIKATLPNIETKRVRFKSLLSSSNSAHDDNEIVNVTDKGFRTTSFDESNFSDNADEDSADNANEDLSYSDEEDSDNLEGFERGTVKASNHHKLTLRWNRKRVHPKPYQYSFFRRLLIRLRLFGSSWADKHQIHGSEEDRADLLTRSTGGKTFRGSYKYSRKEISMAICKHLFNLIIQKSTLALFGAFLIHVSLGTVYTLSNVNSYMTSYMRKHGTPNATYGASMWISSSYAVGQGFSMVLGGYIEKRFSAQLSCILGCALHSMSIMSTSWAVDHGPMAVLLTYGFLPGFGCGLAYMTPMSNGFGWYPHRKGLVAGVILAGFGIGTFIFNMVQTAYVNPDNLSPLETAEGYFTQESILDKVPNLFVFIGSIYAAMQFVGCCLLFKPPDAGLTYRGKSPDQEPIFAEQEMSMIQAIKTREFHVLFLVYGITTQGVLFVNSMIKEYGQLFIGNDMYLAWTGSMASIANSMGRLMWGLAIDRYSFTQCFTSITIIFASLMFIMPFEFILSSKLLYLLATLGIFGSFSGWMSTYPVHLSRVFGRTNSGMIYGLVFVSQVSRLLPSSFDTKMR